MTETSSHHPGLSPVEAGIIDAMQPAFRTERPDAWRAGVIFASPHSGRIYPQALRDMSLLSATQLRRNEDMFVDELYGSAPACGAPLHVARFPRCFVDANRAPGELPLEWGGTSASGTARAQAGLGVVPTHIGERTPIYRKPPTRADALARLELLYHPYHRALTELIETARERFGQALLIDCHSMPGFAPMGSRRPDIILGDRFGQSCTAETLSLIRTLFQDQGFSVAINYPYAGGFVTEHYGRPSQGVETVQIELNRDLYLNPVTLAPKRGYDDLKKRLSVIVSDIIEQRSPLSLAAQ